MEVSMRGRMALFKLKCSGLAMQEIHYSSITIGKLSSVKDIKTTRKMTIDIRIIPFKNLGKLHLVVASRATPTK